MGRITCDAIEKHPISFLTGKHDLPAETNLVQIAHNQLRLLWGSGDHVQGSHPLTVKPKILSVGLSEKNLHTKCQFLRSWNMHTTSIPGDRLVQTCGMQSHRDQGNPKRILDMHNRKMLIACGHGKVETVLSIAALSDPCQSDCVRRHGRV